MSPQMAIEIAVGGIVSLLGWSLNQNVRAFGKTLEEARNEIRTLAAVVGSHTTELGVLKAQVTDLRGRIEGIEDRERTRAA